MIGPVLALAWAGLLQAATPAGGAAAAADRVAEASIAVIDLNQATAEELTRLPGIGPKRAEAIVARRKERPFVRVTQLLEVKGIGKKTLERLRPHLRVGAPSATAGPTVPKTTVSKT